MTNDLEPLFLSAERAEALASWKSSASDVLSLYLPVDESGRFPAQFDRLVRETAAAVPALKALARDVERLTDFVRSRFVPRGRRGLCAFVSSRYGIFEAFATPEPFTPSLRVADRPYLRPLTILRARYYRFIALQADARGARFTEIHLGEPSPLEALAGDFRGRGLVELAERAAAHFRARRADRLVLGAEPDLLAALEPLLDPVVAERLIHESLLGPDRPVDAVVERVRHEELEALRLREDVLVSRFLDELDSGFAVAGLDRVADALQGDRVERVLVRDGWAKMGRSCPACRRLSVDHRSCPWCFKPTAPVLDLVAELCDRAVGAGIEVFRVSSDPRFDGIAPIGAEIAVPAASRRAVPPAGRALRGRFALKSGGPSPLRAAAPGL